MVTNNHCKGLDVLVDSKMVMERDNNGYKYWRCLDCGYQQKLRKDVLKHVERRHLHLSLSCNLCPAILASRCELRTHVKSKHGDPSILAARDHEPIISDPASFF